ncbi:hypothetical protein B0H16DRAFT_1450100 [Mycena metata]|uniref:Uncharacterized protein n=1 Tax=Mycena metata TaxID=1033252 RepID=A0AAD7K005_9AGAR|nr:hypothetical protein B0H16DRAFT_1450100 [Mycena metata]
MNGLCKLEDGWYPGFWLEVRGVRPDSECLMLLILYVLIYGLFGCQSVGGTPYSAGGIGHTQNSLVLHQLCLGYSQPAFADSLHDLTFGPAPDTHLCLNSGVGAEFPALVFHKQASNLCLNLGQVEAKLRQK